MTRMHAAIRAPSQAFVPSPPVIHRRRWRAGTELPVLPARGPIAKVLVPKTEAIRFANVLRPTDSARALARALCSPNLTGIAAELGTEHPPVARLLAAFAVLSDVAVHAPNYREHRAMFAGDRLSYRRIAGRTESSPEKHTARQLASRDELLAGLEVALASPDPRASLERLLAARFLAEVGAREIRARPVTDAIIRALEQELLVPLRAINELPPTCVDEMTPEEKRALGAELTRSVVEGRFDIWRANLPASKKQLSILPPTLRAKWLDGIALTQTIAGSDGSMLALSTRDVTGLELFWATKIGGPSHGFDSYFPECVLALLANARNGVIAVDDPRWPTGAARAYVRLLRDELSGAPVLYLENPQRDFEHRALDVPVGKLILRHALERAKQLGTRLIAEEGYRVDARDLKIDFENNERRGIFDPAAIMEAGTMLGTHHMRQEFPVTVALDAAIAIEIPE